MRYFKYLPLIILFLSFSTEVFSQNISPSNLRDLDVSALSDAEIRQIDNEIRDRGLSLEQFQQLAVAQGTPRMQVTQLISRIRNVRSLGDQALREGEEMTPRQRGDTRRIGDLEDRQFTEREEVEDFMPDSLKVFGRSLFSQTSVNFEPSFNVPTPADYTLGAGDQLVIDIWGAAEQTYNLTVSAEGNIRIPNLGPIYVNGLQMNAAEQRILNRLTDIYSGLRPNNPDQGNTFAQVSLGSVRSIKVTVIGEVEQPGTYTISSLSTAFNALYASGGPTRNGTFRNIRIIRDRQVVETLDMYDFLIYGDQMSNIRLRDQDVIQVAPYENRVHVWGETKRVGFFETREGETLDNLIDFVAGFTDKAYTRRLTIEGTTPTMNRVTSVFYPEGGSTPIRNGDKLRVGEIIDRFENRIRIIGSVFRPGVYEYREGLTLYDLLEEADGLTEDALRTRGVIERLRENREPEMLNFSPERVLNDPAAYDVMMRPDDVVRILSIFDVQEEYTIMVRGAVNNEGPFGFRDGITLADAIFRAEGFRDRAAAYRVEVARRVTGDEDMMKVDRVAEIFRFEVDEHLGFREDDSQFLLKPYDQIYVRTKPNYQEQLTVQINGEVQFPGEYVLSSRDMRLSELVEMAGGLSDYAFPRGASLERILEVSAIEQLDFLGTQAREQEERAAELDTLTTPVGIRLADALSSPRSGFDLILEAGDVVNVPKELQTVRIEGEVLNPTSVRYNSRRSFRDYIDAAGGITDEAQGRRAYIVYANGEVDRSKRFLFFRNNPSVEPGATIVIPRKPDAREMSAQERVALASSIASTALVLVTIVDRLSR